ncbi:MAG: type II toxin-antitoxin system Phd/YefM family antitoxin [Deltaproteobacteria bacterium]|nr:type II toxin-antitoxin system Phd/YefM family antitoxin [Deltaproteobacteria bacterium]
METFSIGELKSRFSEVISELRKGREIVVSYGKKKEKVAVLIPYDHYKNKPERKLGILKDGCKLTIHEDFKINDEELLSL